MPGRRDVPSAFPRSAIRLNPFQLRVLAALAGGAREVWAIAGNRSGKSVFGGLWAVAGALSDAADEITWVCCESSKTQREATQVKIMEALADFEVRRDRRGRPMVNQSSGGRIDRVATTGGPIQFRNYEDGPESARGASAKRTWLDEEPPLDYYKEVKARTVDTGGRMLVTLTAVDGRTPMLRHILEDRPDVIVVEGSMRDNVENLPPGAIEDFEATLDEWEREVRIGGRVLPLGGRPFVPGATLAALSKGAVVGRTEEIGGVDFEVLEEPGAAAVVGVDAAYGVGRDHGAIMVGAVADGEIVRDLAVAIVDVTPSALADAVAAAARRYGAGGRPAPIMPEANGPGLVVIGRLEEMGIPVLRRPDLVGQPSADGAAALGFMTSARTRPVLLEALRRSLVSGRFRPRSRQLIEQLGGFVWGDRRPEAAAGFLDDAVVAAALAVVAAPMVDASPAPRPKAPPRGSPAWNIARLSGRRF